MKLYYWLLPILLHHITIAHEFRTYQQCDPIAAFYYENHTKQTLDFVLHKKKQYIAHIESNKHIMSIWQALELLNTIVDNSDPDTQLPQIQHALQTAEALRNEQQPRWLILTGLIHDLGKLLITFGEPQWAVVGDTFPVGCAYQQTIIYPDYFKDNPDSTNSILQTQYGIYTPHCGLNTVHLSFGHDEYLYQVVKNYLPEEALYIIRYHSFYAQHQHNTYDHLLNEYDQIMFQWVKFFQAYDLYSKNTQPIVINEVKPYYQELIAEFFPTEIAW